jgi:hypothetical protein
MKKPTVDELCEYAKTHGWDEDFMMRTGRRTV